MTTTATFKFGVPPSNVNSVNYAIFPSGMSQSTVVPANAESLLVILPIGITLPYKVFVCPDWDTTHWTSKSNGNFTVGFGTPCPSGGGTIRLGLVAG